MNARPADSDLDNDRHLPHSGGGAHGDGDTIHLRSSHGLDHGAPHHGDTIHLRDAAITPFQLGWIMVLITVLVAMSGFYSGHIMGKYNGATKERLACEAHERIGLFYGTYGPGASADGAQRQ